MTSCPDKRVLYVCNRLGVFVHYRFPLARAARDAGWEVHVAGPGDETALESFRDTGFTFHRIDAVAGRMNPLSLRIAVRELAALYEGLAPDLVHAVPLPSLLHAGLAARRRPVPAWVGAATGLGYFFTDGPRPLRRALLRTALKPLLRRALELPNRAVIVQNADDGETLRAQRLVSREAVRVIRGSGVDIGQFAFAEEPPVDPATGPEILLVARLLWDKGVADFVAASELLARRGVRARCVLLGAADRFNPEAVPEERLERWRASGAVRIEAALPAEAMPARWARCHVACLPSYREGLPKSLLEALAVGRAVVATDVPGCRDLALPGQTGWRVPPRDPAALADALADAIAQPARRAAYGRENRRRAESEFALDRVNRETLALYGELLRGVRT